MMWTPFSDLFVAVLYDVVDEDSLFQSHIENVNL